jgi:transposase
LPQRVHQVDDVVGGRRRFLDDVILGSPEFRRQMVELVSTGRSPEELAQEFEPTAQSIRNWVGQAECDAGRSGNGLTTAEREELAQLRRENRQLRLERDILSNGRGSAPPVV